LNWWGGTANCDFQAIQMKLPLYLFILFYFSETSLQLAGANSKFSFFKSSFLNWGKMVPQFDDHIFQMGW